MPKNTDTRRDEPASANGVATASTGGDGSPQFTPGPWQVVETRYDGRDIVAERRIFTVWTHGQLRAPAPVVTGFTSLLPMEGAAPSHGVSISETDARLIAAAPELLAALKECVIDCEMSLSPDVMEMARAAIAKAEGR